MTKEEIKDREELYLRTFIDIIKNYRYKIAGIVWDEYCDKHREDSPNDHVCFGEFLEIKSEYNAADKR